MRKLMILALCWLVFLPTLAQDDDLIPVNVDIPFDRLVPITPENAAAVERAGIIGTGSMGASIVSPDGRWRAFTSLAGIWIYDMTDWSQPPRLIESPAASINDVVFSRDGRVLIAACEDKTLRAWSFETGELLTEYTLVNPDEISVFQSSELEISPDGRKLIFASNIITGSYQNFARAALFEIDASGGSLTLQLKHRNERFNAPWYSFRFTPDSTAFWMLTPHASQFEHNHIVYQSQLYDAATGEPLTSPLQATLNAEAFYDFRYTPDGSHLIIERETEYEVVDTATASTHEIPYAGSSHEFWYQWSAVSPDSRLLALYHQEYRPGEGVDHQFQIWRIDSGEPVSSFVMHMPEGIYSYLYSFQFTIDSTALITALPWRREDEGQTVISSIQVWDAAAGTLKREFLPDVHPDRLEPLADGEHLLIHSFRPLILSLLTGAEQVIETEELMPYRVEFQPDNRLLIAQSYECLQLDLSSQSVVEKFRCGEGIVARHPAGEWAIVATSNRRVGKVYLPEQQLVGRELEHNGELQAVAMHPAGDYFVTAAGSPALTRKNSAIRLWDFETLEFIAAFGDTYDGISQLRYSPDGNYLVSAHYQYGVIPHCATHLVQLWDVTRNYQRLNTFEGYGSPLLVTPDNRYLVTQQVTDTLIENVGCERSGVLTLLDLATGEAIYEIPDTVISVALSPDGTVLAGGTPDGRVVLWDARTGSELTRFFAQRGGVTDLSFSPDGHLLATGTDDFRYDNRPEGVIKLWGVSGDISDSTSR